jgi:quercetin dioxygenase-like cupin family protein
MNVRNYRDVKPTKDEKEVKGVVKREVITADDGAPNFCMRVFEVEPGSSTAAHSHDWEHEVFILSGRGVVAGEQGAIPISKDSVIFVAPNEHHCFVNNGNEPLRFVCLIPLIGEEVESP